MSPNSFASCFSPSANDCAWVFTSSGGSRPSTLSASLSRRSWASSPLLAIFSVEDRSIFSPALFVAAQMLSSAAAYAVFELEYALSRDVPPQPAATTAAAATRTSEVTRVLFIILRSDSSTATRGRIRLR